MKLAIFFLTLIAARNSFALDVHDPDYQKLCSYDDWCSILRQQDGNLVGPSKLAVKITQEYKADILAAAKAYGIDPRALAGVLVADISITPIYQTEMRKNIVNPKNQNFQVGIVHVDTAASVEKIAAKAEGRAERKSNDEIGKAVSTPKGSIYYAAAVIRDAIDTYKNHGIDISKRLDVQATLYNLGKVETRAKKAQDNHTDPRYNFFGFFVKSNMDTLNALVDSSSPPTPAMDVSSVDNCKAIAIQAAAEYGLAKTSEKAFKTTSPVIDTMTAKFRRAILGSPEIIAMINNRNKKDNKDAGDVKTEEMKKLNGLFQDKDAANFCKISNPPRFNAVSFSYPCAYSNEPDAQGSISFTLIDNTLSVCGEKYQTASVNVFTHVRKCHNIDLITGKSAVASETSIVTDRGYDNISATNPIKDFISDRLPVDCLGKPGIIAAASVETGRSRKAGTVSNTKSDQNVKAEAGSLSK